MVNFIAVTLAALIIPTASLDTIMPDNYSDYRTQYTYLQQENNYGVTIFTPNGTLVTAYCQDEADSNELDKLDDTFIESFNNYYGEEVKLNVSLLERASYTYNNFTYALYMYWGGTTKCLITEAIAELFLVDSFIKVNEPQENDIVCYYSGNVLIHTGIIKYVFKNNANSDKGSNLTVQSKWYPYGIYQHRGDLCPYMPKYNLVGDNPADHIAYYRRHTHNFAYSDNGDGTHTAICSECGMTKTVNHSYTHRYTPDGNSFKWHYAFCICGVKKTESHTMKTFNNGVTSYTFCGKCFWSIIDVSTKNSLALNFKEFIESLQNK